MLATLLAGLGTLLVLFLLVAINVDIISRFVLNRPIAGVTELVELSIVAVVFCQLPHALRTAGLVRSGELQKKLHFFQPRTAQALSCLYELIGALFFGAIAAVILPRLFIAIEGGHFTGNPGVFTVPTWPTLLIIFIGSAMSSAICIYSCFSRLFSDVLAREH